MLTKAEGDFHNPVDSMNCFVDSRQPLSPDTLVITHWPREQCVHGGKDGGDARMQHHGLPLTKAGLVRATTVYPVCRQQRPTLNPYNGTNPQSDQPAP